MQHQQMRATSDANVTVIHVSGSNCSSRTRLIRLHSWHRNSKKPSSGLKRRRLMQCVDCSRKLNEKKCQKEARFCEKCFKSKKYADDCLRVVCLECCVNRHNGHKLITLNELECEHHNLVRDLRTLQQSIQKTCRWMESSLKVLSERSTMPSTDYDVLCKAKQDLQNECEADMRFAFSVLENHGTTPLPPTALRRMRQHQYHNNARMHKLLHFIEKCNQSESECYNRSIKLNTSMSLFSLDRQMRIAVCSSASDSRSVAETVRAVLTIAFDSASSHHEDGNRNGNGKAIVEEAIKVLNRKTSTKAVRRAALLCCAKHLRESIDETTSKQSVLLYIDAYLHIFYQLNFLVTRFPSHEDIQDTTVVTRWDIWKLVQVVYSDLMKCAAKHWHSEESERVDLVDDLAFLCLLYSDICDEATITICMIEAARARAAATAAAAATGAICFSTANDTSKKLGQVEDYGRLMMNIRLDLIDEHLLECRRVQKLQQLRTSTVKRPQKRIRQSSVKCLCRLLLTCFGRCSRHS
uniref:CRC domain-containing protein n=1 Tax=Setaria digitata TaxID=48799 RepID=A0A915Q3E0_9BILA